MSRKLTDPFGSMRIILPEHKEAILKHQYERSLVPKPVIEQDMLIEWSYLIQESIQDQKWLHIQYWHPIRNDLGEYRHIEGFISFIDRVNRKIKINNEENFNWIHLDQIVKLEKI